MVEGESHSIYESTQPHLMKQRAWREINAVAGEWGMLTLEPRRVNLEHKVLEIQETAVYSNAVNIAMTNGSVV
jgi:hypothetical protein